MIEYNRQMGRNRCSGVPPWNGHGQEVKPFCARPSTHFTTTSVHLPKLQQITENPSQMNISNYASGIMKTVHDQSTSYWLWYLHCSRSQKINIHSAVHLKLSTISKECFIKRSVDAALTCTLGSVPLIPGITCTSIASRDICTRRVVMTIVYIIRALIHICIINGEILVC